MPRVQARFPWLTVYPKVTNTFCMFPALPRRKTTLAEEEVKVTGFEAGGAVLWKLPSLDGKSNVTEYVPATYRVNMRSSRARRLVGVPDTTLVEVGQPEASSAGDESTIGITGTDQAAPLPRRRREVCSRLPLVERRLKADVPEAPKARDLNRSPVFQPLIEEPNDTRKLALRTIIPARREIISDGPG